MNIQKRKKPASARTLILAFTSPEVTTTNNKGGCDHAEE